MMPDPDELIIRIKPEPGRRALPDGEEAGRGRAAPRPPRPRCSSSRLGDQPEPYERLLRDALRGDAELFPNVDAIEETWRIVQPLLDDPPPVEPYEPGTWGPEAASHLLTGHGGWRKPWLPE